MKRATHSPRIYHGCIITRVIDGDTIKLDVDLGFYAWLKDVTVRVYGINCPEMDTDQGKAAKQFTEAFLATQPKWAFYCYGSEKYGRWLGDIASSTGDTLASALTMVGLATIYLPK